MDIAIDEAVQDFLDQTDEEMVGEMLHHCHIHQQHQVQVFQPEGPTPAHPQSQYQLASHSSRSEPLTTQGDPNQVHATLPSVTPSSSPNQIALPGTPADVLPQCPACGRNFFRPQERNRHIRASLPHFLFCPILSCKWRGDRSESLNSHWVMTHANLGATPKLEECIIYDPNPFVQKVVSGELPIESAEAMALQAVENRAQELGKVGVWTDLRGRKQRVHH